VHEIGVRELRANAAAVIRRAHAGERIVITVGGRPMAQLGPVEPVGADVTLADLAARGLVVPARRPDRPAPTLDVPLWAGARLDRLVAELRGT
jgi:prevent-host-death family protein